MEDQVVQRQDGDQHSAPRAESNGGEVVTKKHPVWDLGAKVFQEAWKEFGGGDGEGERARRRRRE